MKKIFLLLFIISCNNIFALELNDMSDPMDIVQDIGQNIDQEINQNLGQAIVQDEICLPNEIWNQILSYFLLSYVDIFKTEKNFSKLSFLSSDIKCIKAVKKQLYECTDNIINELIKNNFIDNLVAELNSNPQCAVSKIALAHAILNKNQLEGWRNFNRRDNLYKLIRDHTCYLFSNKDYEGKSDILDQIKTHIKEGEDLYFQDSISYTSVLSKAVACSWFDLVIVLIDAGSNPNFKEKCGVAILEHAVKKGNENIIDTLLPLIFKTDLYGATGARALIEACKDDDCYMIAKKLIEAGAGINLQKRNFLKSALEKASAIGSEKLVNLLLDNTDICSLENFGIDALVNAIEKVKLPAVKVLVTRGVSLENFWIKSALEEAIEEDSKGIDELVEYLLGAGILNYISDKDEAFLLKAAIYACNLSILRKLIEAGIKVKLKTLRYAIEGRRKEYYKYYDPNADALNSIIEDRNAEIIKYLIEVAGTSLNLNERDRDGETVLMLAARQKRFAKFHDDILKKLVQAGANIDLQNNNGDTAIMIAGKTEAANLVYVLFKADARLDIKNNDGHTAADFVWWNLDLQKILNDSKK